MAGTRPSDTRPERAEPSHVLDDADPVNACQRRLSTCTSGAGQENDVSSGRAVGRRRVGSDLPVHARI